MLKVPVRFSFIFKCLFLLGIAWGLPTFEMMAQTIPGSNKQDSSFVFDEFPVLFLVEGYGSFYFDVLYSNKNALYVNVEELFKMVNIACVAGQKGDSLGGFIETESQTYVIDFHGKQIRVGSKTFKSENRLVKETGAIYMESSLFEEAFGIKLTFNFRALTIILKSNFELPVIKLMRIEKMRTNMSKYKGEIVPDTIVNRHYHLFKFGMVDWAFSSTQAWKTQNDYHFTIAVGSELLYGEADIAVDYYNHQTFDYRQLQYIWRWVDNDKQIVKQAQAGKLSLPTIAFINSPMIGASVRNSSTIVRKAKGYYPINAYTEPNWTVELYINNVLVDYTRADASGLYVFRVPIVYGNTTLKLKFYGPMGEERTEERTINVPYTVMPVNEFEYGLSGGVVQDFSLSRFGKGEVNYGVNRFLTIGGGAEYLSSIPKNSLIPYGKITIQPFNKLTLNGEYAHGVRTATLLEYYFWKDAVLEIDYANYVKGQLATRFNANEERKFKLSMPFRLKKLNGFAKIDYQQLVYNEFHYNQGTGTLSFYYKQVNVNSSTLFTWTDHRIPFITSDLSLSYRLKNGYNIRSMAQYDVSERKFITFKVELEKRVLHGYYSVSYERNILFNGDFITLNFKYDFPFARTNVSATGNKGNVNVSESAQGSLAFGNGNNGVRSSNNSSVTKGGMLLYPFLDLNNNGIFDKGEPMVKLTAVRVMGGNVIFSKKDSILRIPELNAFISYFVSFDDADLPTISWRFKNKLYQVLVDPNQFKRVDIPIIIVGEASGTAYLNKEGILNGIGRIIVKFYHKNSDKVVAQTLSERDGYIDYMGLPPGEYVARIDAGQLSNLNFTVDPPQREFTIKATEQGDIVEGIDFVLKPEVAKH